MSHAWGRLVVLEREDAYVVASEADQDDWLCRFERQGDIRAQRWAENMVATYNRRLERRSVEYPGGADLRPSHSERYFDEAGAMQLIGHCPFGARLNRRPGDDEQLTHRPRTSWRASEEGRAR